MEGDEVVNNTTNVVTRYIYILNDGNGLGGVSMRLDVYRKTDTISSTSDSVAVTKVKSVGLPVHGDTAAKCFMAANKDYIYVGTDQSSAVNRVAKAGYAVEGLFSAGQAAHVSSISSDKYGFATVAWGTPGTSGASNFEFRPDGSSAGSGGGTQFMLNTFAATSTDSLSTASVPAPKLWVRFKNIPMQNAPAK
jgi:hypothetical protein